MKKAAYLLISCVLVAVLPLGHAQFPANNEWEFGWDTDVEPSYDLELDGDKWEIEDTLVFYVDNPRINDLSLTITVEFENDVDVLETSYSESISVGSQTNETFSIELSTSDAEKVRSHSPSEKITMIVTAEESGAGAAGSSKAEVSALLSNARCHWLDSRAEESRIGRRPTNMVGPDSRHAASAASLRHPSQAQSAPISSPGNTSSSPEMS